jgi:uncharacterized protein (TIGR02594 family)
VALPAVAAGCPSAEDSDKHMPRVPRPDELPRAALQPANEPPTINIGVASRIGDSGRAMGRAIESFGAIGNAFAEVGGKIAQTQDSQALANARLAWMKGDHEIQTDLSSTAGEDGSGWTAAPDRYRSLNEDIGKRYQFNNPNARLQFESWRENNTARRGFDAARNYQTGQRDNFVRTFDQDVAGFSQRVEAGEVDPESFNQYTAALKEKLGGMNRRIMSESEVQAKSRELEGRIVGSLDRYLATKDPAERDRFWGQVRGGRYEIDQPQQSMRGGSPMEVAKSFLGASETRDTEVLSGFFSKAGGQKLSPAETAWCAAFVNAALGASGQKGTGTLLARDFLKFGTATNKPQQGDIVVLSRGNSSWQGHVGFYAGRDANGNILVLGGNQGDKVSIAPYAANRVLGFRSPPKVGTEIPGLQVASGSAQSGATHASGTASSGSSGTTGVSPAGAPPHVVAAAERVGMEPAFLAQVRQIESSGNPNKRTGSYAGEFQLSEADFRKYGGKGSITDPEQNALAAANKFADLSKKFTARFNREPTPGELYLMHQQGEGGAAAHISNPDRPAWQSMASTAEGRQRGEAWAKQAIWGNLTPEAKRQFGSVDNVTSRQFVEFWSGRVEGGPSPSQGPTRLAQANTGTATDASGDGAAPEPVDANDPAGSYDAQPANDNRVPQPQQPGTIPMGRLVPGQTFTIKTPRGEISITSDMINALPARQREQMARNAGEAYKLYERQLRANADEMMKNGEASIAATGKPSVDYDPSAIRLAYQKDPKKVMEHARRMRIAGEIQNELADAANMPDDEVVARIERLRPQEGAPDFAERQAIFDQAEKRVLGLMKLRETDPGKAVEVSKEVQSVRSKLVGGVPRNKLDAIALMDARMTAQRNLDIPEHMRSPLTGDELRALAKPLRGLNAGDALESIQAMHDKVKTTYGDKYSGVIVDRVIATTIREKQRRETFTAVLRDLDEGGSVSPTTVERMRNLEELRRREKELAPTREKPPSQPGYMQKLWNMLPARDSLNMGGPGSMPADPPKVFPKPTPKAIARLKKMPDSIDDFEEVFSPGSASSVIPGIELMLKLQGVR